MAQASLEIRIHVAWWARAYLQGVILFAWTTGMEPDWEKVSATVLKGVKATIA